MYTEHQSIMAARLEVVKNSSSDQNSQHYSLKTDMCTKHHIKMKHIHVHVSELAPL